MKKNKKMIIGFIAPAVIIFLIVFLYPIIRTIMMSMYKIESVDIRRSTELSKVIYDSDFQDSNV